MKLLTTDGIQLTLRFEPFHDLKSQTLLDSNSINLKVQVIGQGITISNIFPNIQNTDINEFIKWLMKLILGKIEPYQYWEPSIPNFSFSFGGKKGDIFMLRYNSSHNLSGDIVPFSLEFLYTDKEISKFIKSLITQLRKLD